MIVLGDANLEHAVAGALWGGFANAGQTCSGIERVYVMREVSEHFIEGVIAGAKRLKIGDPVRWDTEIGPMVSREQFDLVRELVDDAVQAGALRAVAARRGRLGRRRLLCADSPDRRDARDADHAGGDLGPVIPIIVVDSEDEALALANDSRFGLGASVWTTDRDKGERFARELEAGMVWINDHMFSHGACQCSWGGVKESGLGRTHSKFGSTSASTSSCASGSPPRCATRGGIRTTRHSAGRSVRPHRSSTAARRSGSPRFGREPRRC